MKINLGGEYLKADQAKKGAVIEILSSGEMVKSDKYTYPDGNPKVDFIVDVMYEGAKKKLRMNKASKVAMVEAFGDQTDAWVGKKASLIVMPTPQGDKKMIVLDPIVSKEKADDKKAWDE